MFKYLSTNTPTHNRFVDASVGKGKMFKYMRPNRWLINDPSASKYNVWDCIYNDPEELITHIKGDLLDNTCKYGNAGLYLYKRDFNKIHLNSGEFNELYFTENIDDVSQYMKSTHGKITNVSLTQLIDEIKVHDFIFLDDTQNEHVVVDNDYIDAINTNGANIMIVKNKSDIHLHGRFRRNNITFINKNTAIVTNY
jgi:hypothetical protein